MPAKGRRRAVAAAGAGLALLLAAGAALFLPRDGRAPAAPPPRPPSKPLLQTNGIYSSEPASRPKRLQTNGIHSSTDTEVRRAEGNGEGLATATPASAAARAALPAAAATARVLLRVVDERGDPFPDGDVYVEPLGGGGGERHAAGPADLPAGVRLRLRCHREGFLAVEEERLFYPGETAEVEFRLRRFIPGRAIVRVMDAEGRPIAGARVLRFLDSATTDGSGAAFLGDLAPGSQGLHVYASGFRPRLDDLAVAEGEEVRRTVVLEPAPEAVAGRVIDLLGAPVEGAVVAAFVASTNPEAAELARATTDAEGRFRLDGLTEHPALFVRIRVIAPEERATPRGHDVWYRPAEAEWHWPPRGSEPLVLLAGERPRVAFRLVPPEGETLPDRADLLALEEASGGRIEVGAPGRIEVGAPGRIAADGTVAFDLIDRRRRYRPVIRVEGFAPAAVPDLFSEAPLPEAVRLDRPATLKGRVVRSPSREPVVRAHVRAGHPGFLRGTYLEVAEAATDAEGRFVLAGLPRAVSLLVTTAEGSERTFERGLDPGAEREWELSVD